MRFRFIEWEVGKGKGERGKGKRREKIKVKVGDPFFMNSVLPYHTTASSSFRIT